MAGIKRCLRVFFLFQALPALLSCTSGERGGAALIVHYYRYTADYGGWNLWVWPTDPPGEGKSFAFGPLPTPEALPAPVLIYPNL